MVLFKAKVFGNKKIIIRSIKYNKLNKNLFIGICKISLATPPEFIKIKNSDNLFLIILYSGKREWNLSSFLKSKRAIALFASQGLLDLNKSFLVLKTSTLKDQPSCFRKNSNNWRKKDNSGSFWRFQGLFKKVFLLRQRWWRIC